VSSVTGELTVKHIMFAWEVATSTACRSRAVPRATERRIPVNQAANGATKASGAKLSTATNVTQVQALAAKSVGNS